MDKKKLLKLISDVVYDTVSYMKDDFVIYEHEPTVESSNDGDNVNVYLEAHKAFIDEEYIVDNIYFIITGEDADKVRGIDASK